MPCQESQSVFSVFVVYIQHARDNEARGGLEVPDPGRKSLSMHEHLEGRLRHWFRSDLHSRHSPNMDTP